VPDTVYSHSGSCICSATLARKAFSQPAVADLIPEARPVAKRLVSSHSSAAQALEARTRTAVAVKKAFMVLPGVGSGLDSSFVGAK